MMLTESLLASVQRFPRSILRRPQAITCQYTLMQASQLLHNQSLGIILTLRWKVRRGISGYFFNNSESDKPWLVDDMVVGAV